MSRQGLKLAAVGSAALLLVLVGPHLAWEHYRVRLGTPLGVLRVGMTYAEAEAALGPPTWFPFGPHRPKGRWVWSRAGVEVRALFGDDGHLLFAMHGDARAPKHSLPRKLHTWLRGQSDIEALAEALLVFRATHERPP
jgi:hypothetical protein